MMRRRSFLKCAAALTAATAFPVPGFSRTRTPSEKLNIGIVGCSGMRGADHLAGTAEENQYALCDVDTAFLDAAASERPDAKKFQDWREMLDQVGSQLDAVLITTTDHTHASIAVAAMRMGLHCYCEKPLAHDVYQIRLMQKIAREKGVVTQMGTQIHAGDNYRRVVEKIRAGIIGKVQEVHVRVGVMWGCSPVTHEDIPCPNNIDWDLWIGPAPMRPYQPCYFGGNWRSYWDFGNGGMGDMACHWIDLPMWALDLPLPKSIEATADSTPDEGCAPVNMTAHYEFEYDGGILPLTWYDGDADNEIFAKYGCPEGSSVLFVGEEGALWSDYENHALLPAGKFEGIAEPAQTIPSSPGHHKEWFDAIRGGDAPLCNFNYGGKLAETVLLGTTAYRCKKKLLWDAENMKAIGVPEADAILHQPCRKGWELE